MAVSAGLLAATSLSAAPATPSAERGSKCRATLVYRSVTYFALEASHLGLRAGPAAGIAREPVCAPGETRYRRVAVRRVVGVRPRVAIARRDVPNVIYIAADRCRGLADPLALVRCLRRSR
jgi:hypothetical protein